MFESVSGHHMSELVSHNLNFSGTERVVGLAYDPWTHHVYWTSTEKGGQGIQYAPLHGGRRKDEDGRERRTFLVRDGDIDNPEGLAYDHLGLNVYFTNMDEGDPSGSFVGAVNVIFHEWTKLIEDGVEKPRGIAVYPERGLLFYADWGSRPGLFRANMDGTSVSAIASQRVKWINGVAVDRTLDRVFWTDANHDRIESARLDGSDRRLILEGVSHPVFISVFEDTLYWSDWGNREVLACDKFTGRNVTRLYRAPFEYPTGLTVYHPLLYPMPEGFNNPCFSARCSHLCFLRPGGGHSCGCGQGMVLDNDRATCLSEAAAAAAADDLPDARMLGPGDDMVTTLSPCHTSTSATSGSPPPTSSPTTASSTNSPGGVTTNPPTTTTTTALTNKGDSPSTTPPTSSSTSTTTSTTDPGITPDGEGDGVESSEHQGDRSDDENGGEEKDAYSSSSSTTTETWEILLAVLLFLVVVLPCLALLLLLLYRRAALGRLGGIFVRYRPEHNRVLIIEGESSCSSSDDGSGCGGGAGSGLSSGQPSPHKTRQEGDGAPVEMEAVDCGDKAHLIV